MSDGNRLAFGLQYTVNVYELDQELQPPDWKMIGNITDYSPPVNQSDLSADTFYYFHSVKLSGDGQVLVTATSKVNNDDDAEELSYNCREMARC